MFLLFSTFRFTEHAGSKKPLCPRMEKIAFLGLIEATDCVDLE